MTKVIIDSKEPKDIDALFKRRGVSTERRNLDVGDYIVGDYCFERKTTQDLFNSIYHRNPSANLWMQIRNLKEAETVGVIIEGLSPIKEAYRDNRDYVRDRNAYWGIYRSIILSWGIPIIKTRSKDETVDALVELYKGLNNPKPYVRPVKKRGLTKEERKSDVLCCAKGIGRATAKKLLNEYDTVKNVMETPTDELTKLPRVSKKVIKRLKELLLE